MLTSKKTMIYEKRNAFRLGMLEINKISEYNKASSTVKPEYLFRLSKQKTKTRVAKMIEIWRRSDPQFDAILQRHLFSDDVIISS